MSNAPLVVLCGDPERREGLVRALSEAGWQAVLSAAGVAEGARLLRGASNACVIVDAELGDVPGPKAVPILRELCPQAKIIFTTTRNTRELEAQVRAQDVFYYHVNDSAADAAHAAPAARPDMAELVAAVQDAIGPPRPVTAARPPRVLIVDDDHDFHAAMRVFLQAAGYAPISAYSQREGLETARRERPDAILLDIIMGSTTDGFEFCREARRDPRIKHTPIVGVSAIEAATGRHGWPDRDPELFPVDGYLSKPVDAERVVTELRRLIPAEG